MCLSWQTSISVHTDSHTHTMIGTLTNIHECTSELFQLLFVSSSNSQKPQDQFEGKKLTSKVDFGHVLIIKRKFNPNEYNTRKDKYKPQWFMRLLCRTYRVNAPEVWKAEIEPLSFGHVGQTIAQSVFMLSCSLVQMFGKSLRLVEMTNPRTFF